MNNLSRLGLAALCLATPAVAQEPPCAGRAETIAHLAAPDGETCFIGAGTDWHQAAPQPGDPA